MVLRIAAVQHDIVWEDRDATFARLQPVIAGAVDSGARLVLLTEMFSTGFSMATDRVAEAPGGPSTSFLMEQAQAHGVWVGGSLPERAEGAARPVNQFVLAAPHGGLYRYAKVHPFSYGGEDRHYASGDRALTLDIDGVAVTPFVCYDLRFADWFWREAPTTDLYVVVANWPASRRLHWQVLLQARAIENQAWVVGVNRVGRGGGLDYVGDTRVIDPLGDIVAAAGEGEEVVVTDIDAARVADVRARFPFLADR